jgi:hypothetical protein
MVVVKISYPSTTSSTEVDPVELVSRLLRDLACEMENEPMASAIPEVVALHRLQRMKPFGRVVFFAVLDPKWRSVDSTLVSLVAVSVEQRSESS